jgi:hypothetical protein
MPPELNNGRQFAAFFEHLTDGRGGCFVDAEHGGNLRGLGQRFQARRSRHQPPSHIPTPWTIPIGKNAAEAISSGRKPPAAQNTIEVSHAE